MPPPFRPRNGFWLAYTNASRSALKLMTPELRRFVGERCTNGCLVLHTRRDEFTELVSRWKQDFPHLKILRYAKVQRISRGRLVGASFFDFAFAERYQWCVLLKHNEQPRDVDGLLWMDMTNIEFRAAIVKHLVDEVVASGCDGLAIDSHRHDLQDFGAIKGGELLNAAWQEGATALLRELTDALGPNRAVMFNGLWGFDGEEQAVKQREMADAAQGIAVEFFGVDGHGPRDQDKPDLEWSYFAENLNAQMALLRPGTFVNVNGQRHSNVYADYKDDYATAVYCYANFLLGPLRTTHGFHYGNFQCAKTAGERSGGYDYFDFQDLRLGAPTREVVKASPMGTARAFQKGLVLVAPTAHRTQRFTLEQSYFTMGGRAVAPGERRLRAGTAQVLLTSLPAPPPSEVTVFTTDVPSPQSEWMVQPVKSGWYRYKVLHVQLRSTDVRSAILIRVEIDDQAPTDSDTGITHGIVVVRPASGTFTKTDKDYPYGESPNGDALNVYAAEVEYAADGAFQSVAIRLDNAMQQTCFRVVSLRAVGRVDVTRITLQGLARL